MEKQKRIKIGIRIMKNMLIDYARFDSIVFRILLLLIYSIISGFACLFRKYNLAIDFLGRIFRHINFNWTRKITLSLLLFFLSGKTRHELINGFRKIPLKKNDRAECKRLKDSIKKGGKPFDSRLIILSPPVGNRKGVMLIKFTDYFRFFSLIFDLDKLARDYILVVEPSFCGYFDQDILSLLNDNLIIVFQAPEPVDRNFINGVHNNWFTVPIGSNCWVNPNVFFPIQTSRKKFDIIMVAIWADFKRHWSLFKAISKLKKNKKIKILLVGKPWPKSLNDIMSEAEYFNVKSNISAVEDIEQPQLNKFMNESRILLLLSQKEGFNKSLIEAMHVDLPVFILKGFNYGYKYEYINSQTGGFIKKHKLVDFMENLDSILEEKRYKPYQWVKNNISLELSVKSLVMAFKNIEKKKSLKINKDIVVKVNTPELSYFDTDNYKKMSIYYKELNKYIKKVI